MGRRPADLSGRKFGMLTTKYATEKRDKRGSVYWHCVCDCGNEVDVTAAGLVHGNYHSCGCLQKKNRQEIAQRRHLVDGTCVEVLEKRKSRKDNMSGFRRVFQLKIVIGIVWISDSRESAIMLVFLIIMTKRCKQDSQRRT